MQDLRGMARVARRWGLYLALGALAGGAGFWLVSLRHPPSYVAQATVQIVSATSGDELNTADQLVAAALVPTYQQDIMGSTVLSDVIGTLHLTIRPDDLKQKVVVRRVPDTDLLNILGYGDDGASAA